MLVTLEVALGARGGQLSKLFCSIGFTLDALLCALVSFGLVVDFRGDSGHEFDCLRTSAKMGIQFLSWMPVTWLEPLLRLKLHVTSLTLCIELGPRFPMHVMAKLAALRLQLPRLTLRVGAALARLSAYDHSKAPCPNPEQIEQIHCDRVAKGCLPSVNL